MPSCSAISTAAPQAAIWISVGRRGHTPTASASRTAPICTAVWSVSSPPHRPQIENGDSRSRWNAIVWSQKIRRSPPRITGSIAIAAVSANASA